MDDRVKRTERGWAGHFCDVGKCRFKRNTLLEYGDVRVVVSTVGNYYYDNRTREIGINRYYETMVFKAKKEGVYWDANVMEEISLDSKWCIEEISEEADLEANNMHENIVEEISNRLIRGDIT